MSFQEQGTSISLLVEENGNLKEDIKQLTDLTVSFKGVMAQKVQDLKPVKSLLGHSEDLTDRREDHEVSEHVAMDDVSNQGEQVSAGLNGRLNEDDIPEHAVADEVSGQWKQFNAEHSGGSGKRDCS